MEILIKRRSRSDEVYQLALQAGISPLLAHIVACRLKDFKGDINGILSPSLKYIEHPELLKDSDRAAARVVKAIRAKEYIGILTDYDVDGVTSHAIIYRALTEYFGFPADRIVSLIGHRLNDGYGVSAALTSRILETAKPPSLIITADCGSSDNAQITQLKAAGIDVVVTDHHAMPFEGMPEAAYAVVNPTRPDCNYPDDTIAGCMVAWLLMAHVRAKLIEVGYLAPETPKLARELDLVSLGTVADCVSIGTAINRAVVNIGLTYLNRSDRPCWRAVRTLLGKESQKLNAEDLGFQIGPRINARSRLADPYAALNYLLAGNDGDASRYLSILDLNNRDRRRIEREMVEAARRQAQDQIAEGRLALVTYLEQGHAGVQGIVASRLTQAFGRPTIVLCDSAVPEELLGSSRSIPELHIRNVLQQMADWQPDLFARFGGHKGAAGLSLQRSKLGALRELFEKAVRSQLGHVQLAPTIWTDGILETEQISLSTLEDLELLQPYGREFEPPIFENTFQVVSIRPVGAEAVHLAFELGAGEKVYRAIWFRALETGNNAPRLRVGDVVRCAFRIALNEFRGSRKLNLIVEHACKT
jgi:single-stranded-DNA-specific exonuclease